MTRQQAVLAVAALAAFGLLAAYGPPAINAAVSAAIFGF